MGTTDEKDLEKWMMEVEQEEEEEAEDALATGLKCRPPRTPPSPAPPATPEEEEEEEEEDEVPLLATKESAAVNEDAVLEAEPQGATGGLLESARSIYFDAKDGTVSTNGIGGTKYSVVGNSIAEKKLENGESNLTPEGIDIPKIPKPNGTSHKDLTDEEQSGLHLKSSENGSASPRHVDDPHLTLFGESNKEVAEWDVERVLDKQDTHDLYCPNCNSCITKRVILRKRKRKIQNLQYNIKREKLEAFPTSSLATNSQSHSITQPILDGSPPSVYTSDQDHETVASFKSFRIFGGRGERESAQNLQEAPVRTTADKQGGKGAMHRDNEVAQGLESQYPPTHQSGQVSSVIPVPNELLTQSVNGAILESQDARKDSVSSSTTSAMMSQDYGEEVAQALKSQYPLNHQSDQVSSLIPAANKFLAQPVNGAAVECQDSRKDFVASSTSATVEIVKKDVEELPHGTVQNNIEDEKNANFSSISRDSPVPIDPHANEQVNFSTTTTTTTTTANVWNDGQNGQVSSTSVSIHHVESRIETSDEHKDTSKRIEGGYDAMQYQSRSEFSSPLPDLNKNLPRVNNEVFFNTPGSQLPGVSNVKLKEDAKLISFKEGKGIPNMSKPEAFQPQDKHVGIGKDLEGLPTSTDAGEDVVLSIEEQVSQSVQSNIDSSAPGILTYGETEYGVDQQADAARTSIKLDILKSIVYGGLVESIASLGVVSSAAGGDATTLNIVALGLAYLVAGLFIIAHDLMDLKKDQYGAPPNQHESLDRYQELLGKRTSFRLHATVAVLSYLVFGLVPPLTYGFSFRGSDNKEYKLIAVAAVSLLCIILLAIGKAYIRKPPKAYIKTILYFVIIGVMSSGISYAVGILIKKLLEKVGWFEPTIVDSVTLGSTFLEPTTVKPSWASF